MPVRRVGRRLHGPGRGRGPTASRRGSSAERKSTRNAACCCANSSASRDRNDVFRSPRQFPNPAVLVGRGGGRGVAPYAGRPGGGFAQPGQGSAEGGAGHGFGGLGEGDMV